MRSVAIVLPDTTNTARHERSQSASSSDKRRKRAALLVSAPPPRRSSFLQCSSSPVSAHPPTIPCLHFPFRLLAAHPPCWVRSTRASLLGTRACEVFPPTLAAHALPGRSSPVPGRGALRALHPLSVVLLPLLSRAAERRPKNTLDKSTATLKIPTPSYINISA